MFIVLTTLGGLAMVGLGIMDLWHATKHKCAATGPNMPFAMIILAAFMVVFLGLNAFSNPIYWLPASTWVLGFILEFTYITRVVKISKR